MRREQPSSNSCLPNRGNLHPNSFTVIRRENKSAALETELEEREGAGKKNGVLQKSCEKMFLKLQTVRVSSVTHAQWGDSFSSNKPRLPHRKKDIEKKQNTKPHRSIKIVFILLLPPHSKHLIKPSLPFFFFFNTHCALLSDILVKYPWYFCNSASLIKGGWVF